jgi:hypothetical protein
VTNERKPMADRGQGRPATHTDEKIVETIREGNHTLDSLLVALGLRSKTTLRMRLDRMERAGLVTVIRRARRDGFTINVREG